MGQGIYPDACQASVDPAYAPIRPHDHAREMVMLGAFPTSFNRITILEHVIFVTTYYLPDPVH